MFCVSRKNGWILRLVLALQLATWSAVGVVLLHKGISSLQGETLEGVAKEADPSTDDLNIESTESSVRRAGKEYNYTVQNQSINKNAKIIQIDPESSLRNDEDYSASSAIINALRNEFGTVSSEPQSTLPLDQASLEISTTIQGVSNFLGTKNFLLKINERVDNPDNKSTWDIIPRLIDKKEYVLDEKISKNIAHLQGSVWKRISIKDTSAKRKEDLDFVENTSVNSTSVGIDSQAVADISRQRTETRMLRRRSVSGTVMAITMIVISAIMLLLGPTVIILRLLDRRRRAKKLIVELSAAMRDESLPPTYEQAVLMNDH